MLTNRKLVLLIGAILLLAMVATGVLWLAQPKGAQVVVTIDGNEVARYSLHTDREVILSPKDKGWHNTLVIRNGQALISESDCDNQICVHTPALQEDMIGIIVCLPHGLVVELQ